MKGALDSRCCLQGNTWKTGAGNSSYGRQLSSWHFFTCDNTLDWCVWILQEFTRIFGISSLNDEPLFFLIASSEVSINTNGPLRTIESSFTVSGAFSKNEAITVTTDQIFSTNGDSFRYYETGILKAVATDGSELTVNADTGDVETFLVTVNQLGAVTSHALSWVDGYQLRCVNSILDPTEITECFW